MIRSKIVLVPFPFDDVSFRKVRPALCLTNPIGHYRHIIVAFITSQQPTDFSPGDLTIEASDSDFRGTGLRVTSVLRLHRLTTLPANLIERELGELSETLRKQVAAKLISLFNLEVGEAH